MPAKLAGMNDIIKREKSRRVKESKRILAVSNHIAASQRLFFSWLADYFI